MDSITLIEAALSYAGKGYSVIPVGKDKKPLIKWTEYQKRKADPTEIRAWFKKHPDANVGIVTGEISDLFVVDLDRYDPEYREDIAMEYFPDSLITPAVETPQGGQHLYFKYPGDEITVAARILPGIDHRGQGGYIIAPPSTNGSGKAYRWVEGLELGSVEPATLPARFKARSINNKVQNSTISERTGGNGKGAKMFQQGTRDESIFHVANCLVKGGMPKQEIEQVILTIANSCVPPFPESEIPAKINSAIQRAERRERNLTEEIREWVLSSNGVFLSSNVVNCLQLSSREERKHASKILSRLADGKDKLIERVGDKNGQFRRIETEIERVDLFADQTPIDVSIPCGVSELCNLYPKNIVVIAGSKSSGKTAFLLNIVRENQDKFPVVYLNSEMGDQEFARRIEKFGYPIRTWKFDPIHRHSNFQDLITDERKIFIIDYLEIHDNFYEVAKPIRQIHEKLKDGICFIAIQKHKEATVGRGGDFSMEKSRLYLTLDYDESEKCSLLKIVDAKSPKRPDGVRGMLRQIKITEGAKLTPLTDWK